MLEGLESPVMHPSKEFHFIRDFFSHFIPFVCLGTLFIMAGLMLQKQLRVERIKIREYNILEEERIVIQTDIAAHASDTMLFSDMLHSACSFCPDEKFFISISEKLFLSLSRVKHVYDQVRYLDAHGHERIRINLENGISRMLQDHELQTKTNRPYFARAIHAPLGDVIISRFDLNIEHGNVEQPLKPMLRFSTPVDNSNGTRIGVVVLNYQGKLLINTIKGIAASSEGDVYLTNKEGYWLIGPTPEEEWGFVPGQGHGGNISLRFPALWKYAQKERDGQIVLGDELFTFSTMTAVPRALHQRTAYPRLVETEHWLLVSRVSLDVMGAEYGLIGVPLVVILVLGAGLVCWFWSSARKKKYLAERSLYLMATTDGLTGLMNRRQFVHCVEAEIERARRHERPLSMVLFDIDHFKRINDTYGHDQGDEVLMALASKGQKICREYDILARVGGEEFAVLLPETAIEQAVMMAERLREAVAALRLTCPQGEIRLTISLGVTSMSYEEEKQSFQHLFKRADTAMYQAKEGGRNRVVKG